MTKSIESNQRRQNIVKTMYVIVDKHGEPYMHTVSTVRKYTIDKFLEDSVLSWSAAKALGWNCIKANLSYDFPK